MTSRRTNQWKSSCQMSRRIRRGPHPAPASSVEVQVFEERVDLSNDMTGWQMIAVGIRRLVLARGELDRLEGPGYAARRAELRRKAKEAERTRDRQAAASQDEAEGNDATEEEMTRERTTSGTTARWHEGCSENRRETAKRDRKRRTPKGGRRLAHHTPLLKIPVWWRRAVLPSLPWVVCFLSFFYTGHATG